MTRNCFRIMLKNTIFLISILCVALFLVIFSRTGAQAAPPSVTIDSPDPAEPFEVEFGKSVLFSATAIDPEGDDMTYMWTSDDGLLSTESTFTTLKLTIGEHTITLVVTDSNGEKGYGTVTVTVQPSAPTINITSPASGASYDYNSPLVTTNGDIVMFEATATDAQDDQEDIKITWRSSIDNVFGSGSSFGPVTLSTGKHLIEAIATDSNGNSDTDSISITIDNQSPVASISLPEADATFAYGDLVTFMGSGIDPEEGRLTGDALVWTSSQGDLIGKGETVSLRSLKSGIHIITLTVTDSTGAQDSESVTITIGNAPPTAEITSPTDGASFAFKETITFKGTGMDDEDGTLPAESLVWTSSSSSEPIGQGVSLAVKDLPTGSHTITLTVTDSEGATATDQIVVVVGNTTPVPVIGSPANNSSHSVGHEVVFEGTASDAEDGDLPETSLTWSSDKDGLLGSGGSLSITSLSLNTHVITLTATDSEGTKGTVAITITVGNASPIVLITSPANNTSYGFGKAITFSGTVTDVEDGNLTGENLSWTSDKDGFLGYGESLENATLSVNSHLITLTATDSGGRTGSASITITVGNASPKALITAPASNSSHAFGKEITFEGSGTDAEDGVLPSEVIKWTSSIGGFLGYGESLALNNLAVGTHTITLTVTDSSGLTGSATINVIITNTPPLVKILTPSNGTRFNLNEYIEFSGQASDSEDGELTDSSLVWRSNRVTSPLGSGTQISTNSLATGQHLITLTATDKSTPGLSSTASITITVGTAMAPTVSILAPLDGATFYINDYIEFKGEASDSTDGALKGESLVWTSNLHTSSLGTGNILNLSTLSVGKHLITLTATNSNNVAGVDFIIITIGNHPPVPFITSPDDGDEFDDGQMIRFSGYATDIEDGNITGSSISWRSDIDGYLGNGVQFSKALSYGDHTISLTAKDSHGEVATKTISLTVNPTEQNQPLSLEDMYVSVPLGQTGELTVTGGHPPYRYYKEYPEIASIDIIGRNIKIVPQSMGETTFKIVDHYNNTKILSLTVTDSLDNVPLADAGYDMDVVAGTGVVLDGTSSFQGNSGIVSWSWSQVAGENRDDIVVLSNSSASKSMFVAPEISSGSSTPLIFRLTVADKDGNSSSDDVIVNISDNGITGYPQGVTTFYTVDRLNNLGVQVAGEGDIVFINPHFTEFIQDSVNRPENMIYGLVDLKIKVEPGAAANIIIYFPQPLGEEFLVYKYSSSRGWYSYSDHTLFSSDRSKAYLVLIDGGSGDDDGLVDGMISDPITFGTKSATPSDPEPATDGGGGGGGGCFISTLFN